MVLQVVLTQGQETPKNTTGVCPTGSVAGENGACVPKSEESVVPRATKCGPNSKLSKHGFCIPRIFG
ncbi:UNVERIFIED_CONTAM: hypothetical protein PYX00_004604 [Menopon gallinae]|uniref:Uncharacterized protein n=1 Tax=Menopon gallinae TaxID=328185 RepID=A0AAW2I5S8_9NEOP